MPSSNLRAINGLRFRLSFPFRRVMFSRFMAGFNRLGPFSGFNPLKTADLDLCSLLMIKSVCEPLVVLNLWSCGLIVVLEMYSGAIWFKIGLINLIGGSLVTCVSLT